MLNFEIGQTIKILDQEEFKEAIIIYKSKLMKGFYTVKLLKNNEEIDVSWTDIYFTKTTTEFDILLHDYMLYLE